MIVMNVKIKKLSELAKIPTFAHEGDAAFDLYSVESFFLEDNQSYLCKTDIALEIEPGFCVKILPRSGLAVKEGITIVNSPGLIDPSYRGNVMVMLHKLPGYTKKTLINIGDRIAQARVEFNIETNFEVVSKLSDSERGGGGFGSTGK